MNCLAVCSECGLKCFEKWTDCVSIEAYSFIAITGDSFCQGAWYGFLLKVKHLLEFENAISVAKLFIYGIKLTIIIANSATMYIVMFVFTNEHRNTSVIFYPFMLNIYLTYITIGVFFSFFDTVSYTMMICMAVDIDLTNITRPEFGPAVFHQNMNVVKKKNRKSKGYVAPKVERDLTKVHAPSFNEDGEEEEPEFNVSQ